MENKRLKNAPPTGQSDHIDDNPEKQPVQSSGIDMSRPRQPSGVKRGADAPPAPTMTPDEAARRLLTSINAFGQ